MAIIILLGILFGAIILRFPIGLAIMMAVLGYIFYIGNIPPTVIFQQMISGANSFPLLAIPLFIFVGLLMNTGGMTRRIFRFARALVGWIPGGLGHVNVVVSIIFAGMSGAAIADVSGLGLIEVKAMKEAGYDDGFSAAITAASSTVSPIIPPSIGAVVYAVMADQSVGDMFAAGIIPGLIMGFSLMIGVLIISLKRGFPRDPMPCLKEIWQSFKEAILGILTPVLLLGGIYSGIFTPTESAAIADVYAFIVVWLIYREFRLRDLLGLLIEVARSTAILMFIICAASSFSWVVIHENIPNLVGNFLFSLNFGKHSIILLCIIIYLILGLFMESLANIMITVPVLLPIILKAGINPVHFGVVMLVTLMIGLNTPPLGVCLYAVANVAKTPIEKIIKEMVPFYICLIIVVLIIGYVPQLTLWLPSIMK